MSVWDLKIVTDKYCVLCILSERKLNDSAIAERFDRHLSFFRLPKTRWGEENPSLLEILC